MSRRTVATTSAPIRRIRSSESVDVDHIVRVVSAAFTFGPVTRTEMLATAVAAHAPTLVFDVLLRLPERRYHDTFDVRGQLMLISG